MTTEYESLRRELHAEIDRRIDAAQPKEWPQEGDECWYVRWYDRTDMSERIQWCPRTSFHQEALKLGMLARTRAEAEAIRDRVSAFNKLWAASVADGGADPGQPPTDLVGAPGRFRVYFTNRSAADAAWASLTDAEREALEG